MNGRGIGTRASRCRVLTMRDVQWQDEFETTSQGRDPEPSPGVVHVFLFLFLFIFFIFLVVSHQSSLISIMKLRLLFWRRGVGFFFVFLEHHPSIDDQLSIDTDRWLGRDGKGKTMNKMIKSIQCSFHKGNFVVIGKLDIHV